MSDCKELMGMFPNFHVILLFWDGVRKAMSEERLILSLTSSCRLRDTVEWFGTSG